ncbi:glutathione S-transferase family protein [Allofranklinella schreckenbergeri]|uniref:Glutathione S-transferase family protein n=1 Tax=Allofranklinella schreckenbergeri TaxID=1076744 RepID=A0A3M6Q616_9BURK|nr:glutathione S-transferase family protein [Allofranklinella schreckenbergeri]RMW97868.1 glutathione S-transferase family protein [Allofranklinella schreckenbergeri]
MPELTLYSARGTCALATHIALLEAGADFDLVLLDFAQQAQRSAGYLALNPKGRVPLLRTPQGVLTETPALLVYVAQRFAQARLAPLEDAWAFAQMQAFNSYLVSTAHVAHSHRLRAARWSDDAAARQSMAAKVPQNMRDAFAYIEQNYLPEGCDWVMGDAYTVADPYLFTVAGWLAGDSVDIGEFPKVAAHYARMQQRPAVQQALAQLEAQPLARV